jgi:hypothetical protein
MTYRSRQYKSGHISFKIVVFFKLKISESQLPLIKDRGAIKNNSPSLIHVCFFSFSLPIC